MDRPIRFGKYVLLDRLAIGGMAEVYAAAPTEGPPRLLAVKRILPTLAEDREFVTMFLDEARIAVQLHHPGIASIHDLGKQGDAYYIAMEYVAGKTLRALLDAFRASGERLPVPLAAYVGACACDALDYAHRIRDGRGRPLHVVHRDVSPANLLLGFDGSVRLIDFGISQAAIRSRRDRQVLRGKFAYMSPEQIRGLPVDRRADVFAMGAVLYEMLTGEKLFTGASELAVLEKVREADVRPPSERNPAVPAGLDRAVLRALSRDPAARFGWASELRDALLRTVAASGAPADPPALARLLATRFPDDLRRELDRLEVGRRPFPRDAPDPGLELTMPYDVRFDTPSRADELPEANVGDPEEARRLPAVAPPRRRGPGAAALAALAAAGALAIALVLAAARAPAGAAADPAPAAAPAAAPGRLLVQPVVAAALILDGVPQEAIDAGEVRDLELAPGPHRVELVTPEGRRSAATVEVRAGEISELLRVEIR